MTRRVSWVLCAVTFGFITLAHDQFTTLGGVLVIGGTTAGTIIGHPHEYVFLKDSVRVNK